MATRIPRSTVRSGSASELLVQGYSKRTTIAEPRLSELVAEYLRIGFDVQTVPHRSEPNECSVCLDSLNCAKDEEVCCDIYVRPNRPKVAGDANEGIVWTDTGEQ